MMKAVMTEVPAHILEWRRRTGADQFDEMWEGVLHITPSADREHQDIEGALEAWLRQNWARPNGCRVYHLINVSEPGTWPTNFRIPDLVLLTPSRFSIDRNKYFEGGPDAIVEIHSPGDETYEKFDFYAKIGVREVWVIDRDSKRPEVFELIGNAYEARTSDSDGWVQSVVAGSELRAEEGKLAIRLAQQPDTLARLP